MKNTSLRKILAWAQIVMGIFFLMSAGYRFVIRDQALGSQDWWLVVAFGLILPVLAIFRLREKSPR